MSDRQLTDGTNRPLLPGKPGQKLIVPEGIIDVEARMLPPERLTGPAASSADPAKATAATPQTPAGNPSDKPAKAPLNSKWPGRAVFYGVVAAVTAWGGYSSNEASKPQLDKSVDPKTGLTAAQVENNRQSYAGMSREEKMKLLKTPIAKGTPISNTPAGTEARMDQYSQSVIESARNEGIQRSPAWQWGIVGLLAALGLNNRVNKWTGRSLPERIHGPRDVAEKKYNESVVGEQYRKNLEIKADASLTKEQRDAALAATRAERSSKELPNEWLPDLSTLASGHGNPKNVFTGGDPTTRFNPLSGFSKPDGINPEGSRVIATPISGGLVQYKSKPGTTRGELKGKPTGPGN